MEVLTKLDIEPGKAVKAIGSGNNKLTKKILVLSWGDTHGASEAAYRWSELLLKDGHQVVLMVKKKMKTDSFIIEVQPKPRHYKLAKRVYNIFKQKFFPVVEKPIYTDPKYSFYNLHEESQYLSDQDILSSISFIPDFIFVGWVSLFVNTNTLSALRQKTRAEIYMLTTDMSPLTGGCHYSWDCKGYETDCKNCPAIIDEKHKEVAHKNLMLKLKNVRNSNIKVIAGSGWTLNQAKKSRLFKTQNEIPNVNGCIDTRFFNSRHRGYAKKIFNTPSNAKIIFTGSRLNDDTRKGISYFVESLIHLWNITDDDLKDNIYVLIAGEHSEDKKIISQIPFKKHSIDYIKDYRLLSLAYQAADVFVCSSIEDSGPLMVTEAMACGTPVVGFEMGYVSDMVINNYNGYKAELKNSADLAKGIHQILNLNDDEYKIYSQNAIWQIEEFSSHTFFLKVINKILSS